MSALSMESLRTGAVISFDGEQMVASGAGIVEAAARLTAQPAAHRDHWLTAAVPVLARGHAWIVPLFWMPEGDDLAESDREALRTRASELGQSIISACRYAYGEPLSVDFAGSGGPALYAAELARTGAATGAWWAVGDHAIVLVYHRAHDGAPTQRMSLQVVPIGWVSERRPTKPKKMPRLDLAWSWSDLVDFAAATRQPESVDGTARAGGVEPGR
ncbi:hypothetical protein AB0N59_03305 [Microbacterium sp. NPDC089321]|uniref:hypothetical protein n=1 Tax=Microbacterium sp. NPDC089321 TaxID=3155183 RepID=UPI00344219C6